MNGEDPLIGIAKEVAKDVYKDGGKPIVKPTGELVGLIPRTIKAALLPLEQWTLQREYNLAETERLLALKLENIQPENIVSPEPHIAVPAIQYLSYCMDNEELREMYANLLANSMNKVVKDGVHPGFVEIIKQLCPDEAKVLKAFKKEISVPTISIDYRTITGGKFEGYKHFSLIGEQARCEQPYDIQKYFNNMERLGLIETEIMKKFTDNNIYKPILQHPLILEELKEEKIKNMGCEKSEIKKGIYELTAYGASFCDICL